MRETFCKYFKEGYGFWINLLLILMVAMPGVSFLFYKIMVMNWVSSSPSQLHLINWRMTIAILIPLVMLSAGLGGLLIPCLFLKTGSTLHDRMLERVSRAPLDFFISHPIGRIINRFSKDTAVADSVLVKQLLFIF